MPRKISGGWPATERRYVPDAYGTEGYQERAHVVTMVRALEEGPDVQLKVFITGVPSGVITIPARLEASVIDRLFRDPPAIDREMIGELTDALIDETLRAVTAEIGETVVGIRDYDPVMKAKRKICAAFEVLAADVAALSGLPSEQRGAA